MGYTLSMANDARKQQNVSVIFAEQGNIRTDSNSSPHREGTDMEHYGTAFLAFEL